MNQTIIKMILEGFITVLVAMAYWAFTKYVKPWLVQNNLVTAAEVAVSAAEAIYGRYNGEAKLNEALSQLKDKGFDINAEEVLNAVKAAWLKLNNEQIEAGVKSADESGATVAE